MLFLVIRNMVAAMRPYSRFQNIDATRLDELTCVLETAKLTGAWGTKIETAM